MGQARIQTGHIRVVCPINITDIETTLKNIEINTTENQHLAAINNLIIHKKQILSEKIKKIKSGDRNRIRRAEIIGTVWKFMAGNPDANDLRRIEAALNNLNKQNNIQISINQAIENRINNITHATNMLITSQRKQSHNMIVNLIVIMDNLDTLRQQTEAIEDAIILASKGMPSSKIFTSSELESIVTNLMVQAPDITSTEELLLQATAEIMRNESHLIYILKIPKSSNATYRYKYIEALPKNHKRITHRSNYVIQNATHVFSLSDQCTKTSNSFICESKIVSDAPTCITELLKKDPTNCPTEDVNPNGIVKKINETTLLIINANINLTSNCTDINRILNGSYIIFNDACELIINGEPFFNVDAAIKGIAYQPLATVPEISLDPSTIAPLELIPELTIEQREQLNDVEFDYPASNNAIMWVSGSSLIIIAAIAKILSKTKCTGCNKQRRNNDIHVNIQMMDKVHADVKS